MSERFSFLVTGFVGIARFVPILLAPILFAPVHLQAAPQQPAQAATSPSTVDLRVALNKYCVTCHNPKLKTGGLVLDIAYLDNVPGHAEIWEKVIQKLKIGVMPPQGMPRPDEATSRGLVTFLQTTLDSAATTHPNPGRPLVHRLNRSEYANAIRDLLGLDVNVSELLPPDDAAYGFDNVADVLGSSPALLQAYLAAARKISAVAVGDPRAGVGGVTYSVRQDLSQDHHLEGLPLGTIGGLAVRHTFPIDGYYDFQVRLYRTNLSTIRGTEQTHEVELTLDGKRILLTKIGGYDALAEQQKNPTITSDQLEAKHLRLRIFVKAGERDVDAAFVEEVPASFATTRLQSFVRDFTTYDAEGAPHVNSITIQGPFEAKDSTDPVGKVFVCRPANRAEEMPCAKRIVSTLARHAYRRTPSAAEIDEVLSFYSKARAEGSFSSGIEFALRRILAGPSFVYRAEIEPANVASGSPYRISDYELASRLSFFLWSSIPDDELLDVAAQGKLHQPGILAQQVRRMLHDPRSEALVNNFAGQWLQLRNLQGIVPNSEMFPDFDDNLRQAFRREAEMFFESIVKEDRNVLDLMTADYTFVNERLAKQYGIPDVFGSYFRRVHLTDENRIGLLGKGAVLMVTSHANSTSPVLRGKWVLENILGSPVPPPPPDVPALKESEAGAVPRTMREQMEQHRASPICASCHKTMDPIGFALENFDVEGKWRTTNEGGIRFNTADMMGDGTKIDGVAGLRQALLKHPDVFVQTFTQKMMVYALGRGLSYQDMPVVRQILRDAQAQDYHFSALIAGIVNSVPFQMRMKSPELEARAEAGSAGQHQ